MPKYEVWSGFRKLGLEEMPDTSSFPRTRWEKDAGHSRRIGGFVPGMDKIASLRM